MRTTIELNDAQRARLVALAAARGEKGFSKLVQEALDRYLDESAARSKRVREALKVAGTLTRAEADAMRAHVGALRAEWR
mgnify:FL=1